MFYHNNFPINEYILQFRYYVQRIININEYYLIFNVIILAARRYTIMYM